MQIQAWHDLSMRGQRGLPMHTQPFTLLRVRWLDAAGQPVSSAGCGSSWSAPGDATLTLVEIQQAYRQRYDLEHFFRFGKQRLLLPAFKRPTPNARSIGCNYAN